MTPKDLEKTRRGTAGTNLVTTDGVSCLVNAIRGRAASPRERVQTALRGGGL